MLRALARDQARAELGDPPSLLPEGVATVVDLLVIWAISLVVLIPFGVLFGLALVILADCGFDDDPCAQVVVSAWGVWVVLTLGSFMISGILVWQRRGMRWASLPLPAAFLSALVVGIVVEVLY